jgi:hypothetical protein
MMGRFIDRLEAQEFLKNKYKKNGSSLAIF